MTRVNNIATEPQTIADLLSASRTQTGRSLTELCEQGPVLLVFLRDVRAALITAALCAMVWLASRLSDGKTGGRYVGKLWDDRLPPNEAAAKALEPPAIRLPGE